MRTRPTLFIYIKKNTQLINVILLHILYFDEKEKKKKRGFLHRNAFEDRKFDRREVSEK